MKIGFEASEEASWYLPVREETLNVRSLQEMSCEPIFYLGGGFAMNEYTVRGTHADFELILP